MDDFIPCGSSEQRHSDKDRRSYQLVEEAFTLSPLRAFEKLEAFPRFASKRSVAKFLCKYEIYKKILKINGAIIECGVFNGAGLFSWAQFTNIFEPANYNRKIVGFDTFSGFPDITMQDASHTDSHKVGDLQGDSLTNMWKSVEKNNHERYLSHIPNMELIQGDFMATGPEYIEKNNHLLVALLYLDFDLYDPTKKALEIFLPRMGKGAIICFDELNCASFPGETKAVLETLDIHNYVIKRFSTDPWLSYIEL